MMIRDDTRARVATDLMGPGKPDEVLVSRPSDCYLTGILFPPRTRVAEEEDEELSGGVNEDSTDNEGDAAAGEAVSLSSTQRQSSAGISFAVSPVEPAPAIEIEIRCGIYKRRWIDKETGQLTDTEQPKQRPQWQRVSLCKKLPRVELPRGMLPAIDVGAPACGGTGDTIPGLSLRIQTADFDKGRLVTAILVNNHPPQEGRAETEEASFFQVELRVGPAKGTQLITRPARRSGEDPGDALIYRNAVEYAVGHTSSAAWQGKGKSIDEVRTTWLPEQVVAAVSPEGDDVLKRLGTDAKLKPRSADWLASAATGDMGKALALLPDAYEEWLGTQEKQISKLPGEHQSQATVHITRCKVVSGRIREAIRILTEDKHKDHDPLALEAFRLANRAMSLQRGWSKRTGTVAAKTLNWRPFQLAFQLLVLPSLARREHPDRSLMDLLWFPTGGGKTEAYLGLIAFLLFYRRLHAKDPGTGAGVSVLMRYTLRLLTIQQFQRATTLICACEHIRRGDPKRLGDVPFSIGLWVGSGATPNQVAEASEQLHGSSDSTPRQLATCPVCQKDSLHWYCLHECRDCGKGGELKAGACAHCNALPPAGKTHHARKILVRCKDNSCEFGSSPEPHLPVWTVDEDIYRERPSLIIGTVDKFTQIARNRDTRVLFGGMAHGERREPPDLIIQDELHLISGPLGTVTALYEIAIDELCSHAMAGGEKVRPKVIGSTATIRAATEQIRSLFDRGTCLFPPPVLDAENSCFAKRDDTQPGRLYIGVTTAGRSPKFSLQAVYASLLQAAVAPGLAAADIDPYWTLVGYFNSLRELGGALVMTRDDVPATIRDYSTRRGEAPRQVNAVDELTSRKSSREIPDVLERLGRPCTDSAVYDVILATNMLSVGVDIPRLGLMVVNGQPKQVAEYIQSTSRVGREYPGLVVTLYNNGRARDRSYFETFASWHSTLYRDVEATSVTPFAPRAVDKALHAVLVVLVRHLVYGMATAPNLTADRRNQIEAEVLPLILNRVNSIDSSEMAAVQLHLRELLDQWERRYTQWTANPDAKPDYWKESSPEDSLLISAEKYVREIAAGMPGGEVWPTPNSMRDVEPGSPFKLVSWLKSQ